MNLELKQIITQIIAFLIMLWILKRYAWKPLLSIMEERADKIRQDFKEIEDKNIAADNRLEEYNERIAKIQEEGQRIIQESTKEARKIAKDIQFEAQKKAQETLKKAQDEADREMDKAKNKLKIETVNVAFQAFEKLLKLKFSKEDREKYALALVEEVNK